jgi:hypothetical protein
MSWMRTEPMSLRAFNPKSLLTIDYSPHPEERSFMERAQTRREGQVETTVAVPSDLEGDIGWAAKALGSQRKNAHRRVMGDEHFEPPSSAAGIGESFLYLIFDLAKGCFSGTAPLD